jgi:murein DD-endopeptidase MepM/ murein hydrolase activator NlpD
MEIEPKNARHLRNGQQQRIQQDKNPRIFIALAITLVALAAIVLVAYFLFHDQDESESPKGSTSALSADGKQVSEPSELEKRQIKAVEAGADAFDPNLIYLPTPLIAEYQGFEIHSPISANHITEIEFHQASYDTALRLTPLVTIVDAEEVAEKHGTKHVPIDQQPTGDNPLIAEAVSTWRLDSVGDEMTSVDVGALAGTDVYAPVTGTVVKIRTYSLFGVIDDFEVHIQAPGHPELDIVLLHVENLSIKVGDKVQGGCTPIAKVRNIGDVIDNNLSNFTAPGDPGNHCHVQINDAAREDYKGLEDALDIFNKAKGDQAAALD